MLTTKISQKACTRPIENEKSWVFAVEENIRGLALIANAPINAKTICDKALSTTTIGNPPSKKPSAVPVDTIRATAGDMNMLKNIATWLANVKDAGSRMNLTGENIGIITPIAIKRAVIVIFCTGKLLSKILPPIIKLSAIIF